MAVLIVDDVTAVDDVVELITYLTTALATGDTDGLLSRGTFTLTRSAVPTPAQLEDLVRLDEEDVCTAPLHRPGCTCIEDAANTDPRQLTLFDLDRQEGAVPYVPCPQRGQHHALTDCWMCWSDVQRGAITADQALA